MWWEATEDILFSLLLRRLPSEMSAEELSKSKECFVASMFCRDLTVSIVSVAQKNKSMDVASMQTAG